MAMIFGKIEDFDGDKEWRLYIEHFFAANSIVEEAKKKSIFFSVIGASSYKLLRSLIAPDKPNDKSFSSLMEVMKKHYYNPAPAESVQRFRFHTRSRQKGESVSTSVVPILGFAYNSDTDIIGN